MLYNYVSQRVLVSDAPIIGSVISIVHYQPLFLLSVLVISERCNGYCKKCTSIVIIASLIVFMIHISIEKMLKESETRR